MSLGELEFGVELAESLGRATMPDLRRKVKEARRYPLDITKRTAVAYGELKSKLAVKYLANSVEMRSTAPARGLGR